MVTDFVDLRDNNCQDRTKLSSFDRGLKHESPTVDPSTSFRFIDIKE